MESVVAFENEITSFSHRNIIEYLEEIGVKVKKLRSLQIFLSEGYHVFCEFKMANLVLLSLRKLKSLHILVDDFRDKGFLTDPNRETLIMNASYPVYMYCNFSRGDDIPPDYNSPFWRSTVEYRYIFKNLLALAKENDEVVRSINNPPENKPDYLEWMKNKYGKDGYGLAEIIVIGLDVPPTEFREVESCLFHVCDKGESLLSMAELIDGNKSWKPEFFLEGDQLVVKFK